MFKQTGIISTTAALLVATMQTAQPSPSLSGVTLTNVGYGGNGCKAGTTDVIISADKKSVSVLFDKYIAEAGGPGKRKFARKKCDIAFALKLPQGLSVSLVDADYRVFLDLPKGAKATFTRDYFFAGRTGPRLKKDWIGRKNGRLLIKDRLTLWSPCGANVILRSKTAASVRSNLGRKAKMVVNTKMTMKTIFKYNFRYKSC